MTEERRAVLAANLSALRQRVAAACEAAGRDPSEVTVIAVTKTFPASDVQILAELGVTDVAENRDQEAREKASAVPAALRWHFVGQLQRNKCRSVVTYAAAVHSVDRAELARALGQAAVNAGRAIDVLLQLDLDPAPDLRRGGVAPDRLLELAATVGAEPGLRLRGVMAVAPREAAPDAAFEHLRQLSEVLIQAHPRAVWISAGMSGDFESAIRHGASHVRVGSVLLGGRSWLRGTVAG